MTSWFAQLRVLALDGRNTSALDRALRIWLGLGLIVVALSLGGVFAFPLELLAGFLIATGVVGFCPFYRFVKLSSRKGWVRRRAGKIGPTPNHKSAR